MAACTPLSFDDVTPAMWQAGMVEAARYGIIIDAPSGEIAKAGFKIRYAYDPGRQHLEMQCLEHLFFVGCDTVNETIGKAIAAIRQGESVIA
ncbi:hypothetical protein [Paracraurococcus ruber]|nr:hypothetical protein [Paracraurococcus ruber]TDG30713.1 hypothetical protein E2C05_13360 [Paracraurococcus ruber]